SPSNGVGRNRLGHMKIRQIVTGGVIGAVLGLPIWYFAGSVEYPLQINLFRYVTFWIVDGVIVGAAVAFLRRGVPRLNLRCPRRRLRLGRHGFNKRLVGASDRMGGQPVPLPDGPINKMRQVQS